MRAIGYYWTLKGEHWEINWFHGELWELLRDDTEWLQTDDYFDEIDEKRLTHE